jgi:KipI family sensor histidine kinase inhibitor
MRAVGDHAALVELDHNASVHAAARFARDVYGDQLVEIVPGHQSLLLVWAAGCVMSDFSELATAAVASSEKSLHDAPGSASLEQLVVPIRYDGEDLGAVATVLGISTEAVVKLHTELEYTVAFVGFSPGFPYLVAGEPSALLELPRLAVPRTEVPAGSVAVAAGYCGVYPRASPGGWNLLGRTDVVLFDPGRERPALLEPGMRVRFEPV